MRFTVNREYLLKALTTVSKAIPQKIELAILQNVKISLNDRGLEFLGSDNNLSIRTRVPFKKDDVELIKDSRPGETLIQFKLLYEIVRRSDAEFISFELMDGSILKISYNGSTNKPNTIRADEYPDIDLSAEGISFDVKASEFAKLVDQTAFAASTKENRPALTAINLEMENGLLTATATDAVRMARKKLEVECDDKFNINIAAKKLSDIVHSFEGADMVNVTVCNNKAIFEFDNTVMSIRLIAAPFPNLKSIMPANFNYFLEVNAREFLSALDRLSLFDGIVKLIMTEDEVEMLSRSSINGSANAKLSTFQYSGSRLEISFKPSLVAEAVKAVGSEDVTIKFVGELKPFVIKNVKDDSLDVLLTPVRV